MVTVSVYWPYQPESYIAHPALENNNPLGCFLEACTMTEDQIPEVVDWAGPVKGYGVRFLWSSSRDIPWSIFVAISSILNLDRCIASWKWFVLPTVEREIVLDQTRFHRVSLDWFQFRAYPMQKPWTCHVPFKPLRSLPWLCLEVLYWSLGSGMGTPLCFLIFFWRWHIIAIPFGELRVNISINQIRPDH